MSGIPANVETGYEARFDWPEFAGRPRPYLLASVPRSGSTFVSHLLWRTGCVGAPLEYLNFEPSGPYGAAHGSQPAQTRIWGRAVRRRTSPNGVFGIKAFPLQLEELGHGNPGLLAQVMRFLLARKGESRVVQLRRRNSAAHAISLARASLSGIWRQEQEQEQVTAARPEPEYDAALVERAWRELALQEAAWDEMYRDLSITPLVLWYEDVVADPEAAVMQVASYLDVKLQTHAAIEVPVIRRQSQEAARSWLRHHARANEGTPETQ